MKDVALAAGVHRSTVSLALRNDPRLPAETRRRIRDVAKRLGYRANPLVAALMTYKRTRDARVHRATLGLVTGWPEPGGWAAYPTLREMVAGVREEGERRGYRVEEFRYTAPGMTARRLTQIFRTRNIRGLILLPIPKGVERPQFPWSQFAAVALGNTLGVDGVARVVDDHFHGMTLACDRLRAAGYRRIGFAMPVGLNLRSERRWEAAFLLAQGGWAADERVPPLLPAEWTAERFVAWLGRERPDAILGHHRDILPWLAGAGRRVPQEVGFASLDCQSSSGERAGICQDSHGIGATAVRLLSGMLQHNETCQADVAPVTLLRGRWIAGKTLRLG